MEAEPELSSPEIHESALPAYCQMIEREGDVKMFIVYYRLLCQPSYLPGLALSRCLLGWLYTVLYKTHSIAERSPVHGL